MKKKLLVFSLAMLQVMALYAQKKGVSDRPAVIPVGYDAYRMWDKWYLQRPGVRSYMRSTYDRNGGNQSADASHFLFAKSPDYNVTLDVKGKGILYFFRANHWHGSPWHFAIDGKDNIVKETATANPVGAKQSIKNSEFIPAESFPRPIAVTWGMTKGADLIWTPMAFTDSLQIAYSRTHYGTGYYIYQLYANEEHLSAPIKSWNVSKTPDADVVSFLDKAGQDIAPKNIKKIAGSFSLSKNRALLANIKAANMVIRALKFSIPLEKVDEVENARLIVTWDNAAHASIDAPLSLFFGAGSLYNREHKEFLVKGLPVNVRFDYEQKKVELACYYPMPFFKNAKFEIATDKPADTQINYEIRYESSQVNVSESSYFHATYKDFPNPALGKDMVFLDTKNTEGHENWSGNFVGTSFIFSHNGYLGTLEGDPRFFFDDSKTPQAYGTGTEEWGGGGDYWGGQNMTLALAGHPCGAPSKKDAKDERDLIESAYRFLLADLMPFGKRAQIHFEHGGENLSLEHYEAVTYWYGLPAASLVKTDSIDIGKLASENLHKYNAANASAVENITSRYELGIDNYPSSVWGPDGGKAGEFRDKVGKEVYPATAEDGRYHRSVSEFTVVIDPANRGVLLRRQLDYSFPNQKAEVYVTSATGEEKWEKAGVWYLAGSNTALYSDPPGELETQVKRTETSNRKFRDDEFMISDKLTKNKSALKIRIKFIPNDQNLFDEFPFPKKSAWSELKYDVYSFVKPQFSPGK